MIRAVLLDAMGTLLELEPPAPRLAPLLPEPRSLPAIERAFAVEIAYYRAHMAEGRDRASVAALRERCARVLGEALGLGPLPAATLLQALRFRTFPDVAPTLRALRAAGLRLVVVSNWDALLPDVLAGVGLLAAVDVVVTSGAVGVA
jgi:putative hydrolase of the HAD superfamily